MRKCAEFFLAGFFVALGGTLGYYLATFAITWWILELAEKSLPILRF